MARCLIRGDSAQEFIEDGRNRLRRHVDLLACQASLREEGSHLGRLRDPSQELERLVRSGVVEQDSHEGNDGRAVSGIDGQCGSKGRLVTVLHEQIDLGGGWVDAIEERFDLCFADRADEAVDHVTVSKREDGRDGLDLEHPRDAGIGVDIHLDELDGTTSTRDRCLKHRPKGHAGAAPRGPQIDDDGHRARSLKDQRFKGCIGDVDHKRNDTGLTGTPARTRR